MEFDAATFGTGSGQQRPFLHSDAVVAGTGIGDNLARIVRNRETLPDQHIQTEGIGTSHFNHAIDGRAPGISGQLCTSYYLQQPDFDRFLTAFDEYRRQTALARNLTAQECS